MTVSSGDLPGRCSGDAGDRWSIVDDPSEADLEHLESRSREIAAGRVAVAGPALGRRR